MSILLEWLSSAADVMFDILQRRHNRALALVLIAFLLAAILSRL
jgi:hypothetical protein